MSPYSCDIPYKNMPEHAHACNVNSDLNKRFVVISCTKAQFRTGGSLAVGIQGCNSVVSVAIITHFILQVFSLACQFWVQFEKTVWFIMSEFTEVTWTVSVYFRWCWHWFAPLFLCFWFSWYLLVAAWKGNVKISFTQLDVVCLEQSMERDLCFKTQGGFAAGQRYLLAFWLAAGAAQWGSHYKLQLDLLNSNAVSL